VQVDLDVAELKANPGVWALVREGSKSAAPAITYKARGCVATSHRVNTSPDRFDIYAMWPAEETPDVKGDDALVDAIGQDCG
jgi:hypothetical protein